MKIKLLILLGIVLGASINNLDAQDEKKRIEQNINIEKNDGKVTVTITEQEGDKITEKVLTGEEAENYLENQKSGNSYFFNEARDGNGDKVIAMKIKEESGKSFVWVAENSMDIDFDEFVKELEALREELGDLNKKEIALRLDEIIEIKKEFQKAHLIEMKNLHHEMMEKGEIDLTVEEKDGVIIITKTMGKTKTVEEIKIDGDNKRKKVYVISTSGEKHERHAMSDELTMNVYPNPSKGNFTIDLELKTDETASVKVLDSNGKEVYTHSIQGVDKHELKVKLKKPSPGVYVVIVEQGSIRMKLKTIIE